LLGLLAPRAEQDAVSERTLTPLAEFLLGEPTAVATLLTEHVADGHGRCRACTVGGQRGNSSWPCALHGAAIAARDARHLRRPTP
jgi:hypothetical protein